MADTYRSIAHIEKTHGRKGEVVAVPAHGLPFMLHEGMSVVLVPPPLKGLRDHVVMSCVDGRAGQLVRLTGIKTLAESSAIVGKTVLARESDLPGDYALHDADALIGRTVMDERLGLLGTITQVMRTPAHDVWVVNGIRGEVLVPVVDAIVGDYVSEGSLSVHVPRGLVKGDEAI